MERRIVTLLVVLGLVMGCGKPRDAAAPKKDAPKAGAAATDPGKTPAAEVAPPPAETTLATADGLNPRAFPDDDLRAVLWKLRYPKQEQWVLEVAETKPEALALEHLVKATTVTCPQFCPNIRAQAARVLLSWKKPSPTIEKALVDFVTTEKDADVLATVISSIDAYHPSGDELPKALLGFLEHHDDKMVRAYSAVALGVFDYQAAKPAMIQALGDAESWVRLMALQGLRKLNARDALPQVKKLVNDPNPRVKERAREVARILGG